MSGKVRKAVLPVAGLGTRVLPGAKVTPKEMLNVVDRPILSYIVEEGRAAGIEHFVFVTGRGKGAIEDYFDHHVELEAQSLGDGGPGDLPSLDQFGQGGGVGVLPLRDLAQLGPRFGDLGRGHETLVLDELDDEIVGGRHRVWVPKWSWGC